MGQEELALLTEVIENRLPFRDYGDGTPHMVNDFESEARSYFGAPYALATATGSGSFFCAMAGLGIGPGDEVIIPSFGWYTDFEAPVLLGALPVFADIDRSLNLDPDDFERRITANTKAVILIHYQGGTNDVDQILEIARSHQISVVEDCAQACGVTYKGRKVGSLGDVSCFSFQQNKIMSTGDGGLLLAKDPVVFERAVRFHDLGFVRKALRAQLDDRLEEQDFCGCQLRMNEFTGAVALAQLRKLDTVILGPTRKHWRFLRKQIAEGCPDISFRRSGDANGDAGIAFYMDMETPERCEWFTKALFAEGIRIGPSSGCCNLLGQDMVQNKRQVHPKLPPFGKGWPGERVEYKPEQCPNTEKLLKSLVCVALAPSFTDDEVEDIAKAIRKVWRLRPKELWSGSGV
ncbi:MAG: DegT/DnrJ/EryC1/StrS family aminotransferase [Verrucomicrobiota bacterium]